MPNSTAIYQCDFEAACLGSLSDQDFTGTCKEGYTGNKCLGCKIGYSRSGTYKCVLCPSDSQNIGVSVILIILILFVSVVLVRFTIDSAYSPKAMYSIYIKIFINYLQLVLLTTKFELHWPYYVADLFVILQFAATASDQIFSLDCYFKDNNMSVSQIYYFKIMITALLPIIIWLISFLVWVGVCLKNKT